MSIVDAKPVRGRNSTGLGVVGRAAQAVLVAWAVTALTFVLLNAMPGRVTQVILGDQATPEAEAELARQLGLDQPLWQRYIDWLGGCLRGDFGESLVTGAPVGNTISERFGVTAELAVVALVLALAVAVPTATLAVRYRNRWPDRAMSTAAYIAVAAPQFVTGIALVLVFSVLLGWLPASGWRPLSDGIGPHLSTLALPALALTVTEFAVLMRVLRATMAQELVTQEYPIAARARGLSVGAVLRRHLLRNASLPLVTIVGLQLGTLLGGTVVIETLFAVPGMGQLLVTAVNQRDLPVVQGVVALVAIIFVVVNLVVDTLYTVIDPRTRSYEA